MEPVDSGNENLGQAGIVTSDGEHIPSAVLRTSGSSSSSSEYEEGTASPLSNISSRISKPGKSHWVSSSNGRAPPGTFIGGQEITGDPIYVARAYHGGDLIPGKLIPAQHSMYVGWRLQEFKKNDYEVLVWGPYTWISGSKDQIPARAVLAGWNKFGETLYIGRVYYAGSLTTGKVQKSAGGCYIPFDSKELLFTTYEILVSQPS